MEIRDSMPRLVAGCLLLCLCGKNPVSTPPTVEFSSTQQTVNKNSGSAALNVVLSAKSSSNVTIPFTVIMSGSTANNPADYTINSTSVVIPAGSLNGSISVSLVNNSNYVPSKTLIVGLNTPMDAKLGTRVLDTLIIVDTTHPTVEFLSTQQTVIKNSGSAPLNLVLSATYNSDVTITFTVISGSTANNPDDYTISSTSEVIPAGSFNGSINVSLNDNGNYAPSKTLIVGLNTPTNVNLGTRVFDTLIIVDTTTPPTIGFSTSSMTGQVSKQIIDQNIGTLNIQVILSKAFASSVTVPVNVLNGSTANNPLDYTLGSSPIVIPAGDTTDSISLSLVPHESYQLSKTVLLTLGSPTNAKLGDSILDTVIIVDKNGFGRRYRISDNEVTGWKQNTDPNQDTFSLWVGEELFSHIDGGADLYLNRGCLVSMYQYMVGPNGPDSQVCMVIAMDFSTAAQADSMFRLQKESSGKDTVSIPDYETSVAIAYPGILGNITAYAHFKAIYFELVLSGYVDQDQSRLIASQLFKVLESKTH